MVEGILDLFPEDSLYNDPYTLPDKTNDPRTVFGYFGFKWGHRLLHLFFRKLCLLVIPQNDCANERTSKSNQAKMLNFKFKTRPTSAEGLETRFVLTIINESKPIKKY